MSFSGDGVQVEVDLVSGTSPAFSMGSQMEGHNFLGGRWELETLLHSRRDPSCAQAAGRSKARQKGCCAWEVPDES